MAAYVTNIVPPGTVLENVVTSVVTPALQKPTEPSKHPIRTRYLGHVIGYQPIRDQYFPVGSWFKRDRSITVRLGRKEEEDWIVEVYFPRFLVSYSMYERLTDG